MEKCMTGTVLHMLQYPTTDWCVCITTMHRQKSSNHVLIERVPPLRAELRLAQTWLVFPRFSEWGIRSKQQIIWLVKDTLQRKSLNLTVTGLHYAGEWQARDVKARKTILVSSNMPTLKMGQWTLIIHISALADHVARK